MEGGRMSSGITRDEWIKALADVEQEAPVDDASVVTVAELSENIWKCSRTVAYLRVGRLVKLGKAEPTYKRITTIDGHTQRVRAYRLK